MGLEIERKFLPAEYPDRQIKEGLLKVVSEQRIQQTYLAIDETQELRVRRITDASSGEVFYTQTFKAGNGLSREEIEYGITQGIYEQLTDGRGLVPLTKDRVTAQWNGRKVEIDRYDQIRLTVLEVEFDSVEEAEGFMPPDWFGRDISSERQYSNKRVWRELQSGSL
ncbi:CYTH domain-containing protein [Paenibacillus glycinis]|uniref:CYTH domain-containing protein n=1 Tax=Paenibacillus glycinis TaxID=2697035 RepID=A0ABW9XWJ0_9BACL|nr:CYTH domain-containing protein [Paenibacillus glycinis]NBD27073.1 CYTH domain-containing protein [Paenibacillus glycinis]